MNVKIYLFNILQGTLDIFWNSAIIIISLHYLINGEILE